MKSNLSEYHRLRDSFGAADRVAFEQYFLGYISSSFPSEDWQQALKAAAKYAAGLSDRSA